MKRAVLALPFALAFALAFAFACGSSAPDPLALHELADTNADPNVVEVTLTARVTEKQYPGASAPTKVWSYDGTVPGPLLRAKVGDRLIVHFKNQLPQETTIHWHGVRVPAAMDGTLATQKPVPAGGSFDYDFVLKDAGLFWFHPHFRSDEQVEKGLYGAILVAGPNEPKVDEERVLVLDDVRVLPDGTFPTYLDDNAKMMGREGNVLLVNGVAMPTLEWRPGALVRLRIVSAANGRFFNLALQGHKFQIIGTDGGFVERPFEVDHILMAPGDRIDALVRVSGEPGARLTLVNDPYDRGHDSGKADPMPVATVHLGARLESKAVAPTSFPAIPRLPNGPVDIPLELDEGVDAKGDLVFMVNGKVYPDVPATTVPRGAVKVLELKNVTEMDHPFHLHGFFFQVLERNGMPVTDVAQEDTLIVPKMTTLKVVARFDEPGMWMYHCHILEHAENGMMGEIVVE